MGKQENKCIKEYIDCSRDIVEKTMLREFGDRIKDNASPDEIKEQIEKFVNKSNIITYANQNATQLKIGKNASMVICPNHITYLDESAGVLYRVKDEAVKVLYNSKQFQEEINACINKDNPDGLIQMIMRYSILNKGINDAVKHFRTQGEDEGQILENVGKAVEMKEAKGLIEYLQASMKQPINNSAKAKLEHTNKKLKEFGLL